MGILRVGAKMEFYGYFIYVKNLHIGLFVNLFRFKCCLFGWEFIYLSQEFCA
jgi:hypothetical protein